MSNLSNVLRLIPTLNVDELEQVRQKIQFLKATNGGVALPGVVQTTFANNADEFMMVDAIVRFLTDKRLEFCSPNAIRSSSAYPAFKKKLPDVFKYLRESLDKPTRTEMVSVLNTAMALLYRNIEKMDVPISTITIMNQIHRIPSVINRAFPGYASAGMLSIVIRGISR